MVGIGKRINIFRTIFLSFYSKKFYHEVLNNWPGYGFMNALIVSLLCAFLFIIPIFKSLPIIQFSDPHSAISIIEQIPHFQFENKKLNMDAPSPYYIKDGNNPFIIFDTSGHFNQLNKIDNSTKILITSDNIQIKYLNKLNKVLTYQFSKFTDHRLQYISTRSPASALGKFFDAKIDPKYQNINMNLIGFIVFLLTYFLLGSYITYVFMFFIFIMAVAF